MKVLVAMSGGVDSSVAALLLRKEGHDVAGTTMTFGYHTPEGVETIGERASDDASKVCKQLGIPHIAEDRTDIFENEIIGNFVSEYALGRTPNPCIRCNRLLKFGALFRSMESRGFDMLATGHYADKGLIGTDECIRINRDDKKDQSYFLYCIDRSVLPRVMFPLGKLTKSDVRKIASEIGLAVAHKKESQDVCFVRGDYRDFPSIRALSPPRGFFVNRSGKVLGEHEGIPFYTIGQRRGLGVSAPAPLYVISFDMDKNEIILGYQDELYSKGCIANRLNFFTDILPENLFARIRYSHPGAACSVERDGDSMKVIFNNPQEAVTPGQSVVLYHGDCVVGGGVIERGIAL